MSKNHFKTYICKPFCVFFREGEKEEMACRGAIIAQRLVGNQKFSPSSIAHNPIEKKDADFNDDNLIRMVCANCSFQAHDCDFRSGSSLENAVPCGGYILLYLLKSNGLISVKDLSEVCVEES